MTSQPRSKPGARRGVRHPRDQPRRADGRLAVGVARRRVSLWSRTSARPAGRPPCGATTGIRRHEHRHSDRSQLFATLTAASSAIIISNSASSWPPAELRETRQILRAAHHKASSAQTSGYRILLIIMDNILRLRTSDEFTRLLVKRLLGLAASGTFQMAGLEPPDIDACGSPGP
jgi:hypothetical protein